MATPRHKLFLLVREANGSVRERLSDCHPISISINPSQTTEVYKKGESPKHVHLSHVTSARMISPILPPEARYVTMLDQHLSFEKTRC